jgi:hypothetical protein
MGGRRGTRILLALAPLVAAVLLALAGSATGADAATARRPSARAPRTRPRVVPSEVALGALLAPGPGAGVTMPPVGLSIEYPVMAQDIGGGPCPPPALAAELLRLGSPPLELAGVSQDETVPAEAVAGPPTSWETATLYTLPTAFWSGLRCLLATARDPLTLGLNVRTGNLAWATQMVADARSAASAGLSVALGNEPDLYFLPNFAALDKPLAGEQAIAARLYVQLASYLRAAAGGAPLIGPELARPAEWRPELPAVVGTLALQTIGVHMYPLSACGSPRAVTIDGLLSANAADAPARLAWVVGDAQAAGIPAILSEVNSAACGGEAGVSDSPAAAVWAVRFVLSALKTGFREVRFHFSGNPYDPFVVRGAAILPRPLEAALVALNQWLPVGSTMRSVHGVHELLVTAIHEPAGATIAILDNETTRPRPVVLRGSAHVHLAVLGPAHSGLETVTAPAAHGQTRLELAPNTLLEVSTAP